MRGRVYRGASSSYGRLAPAWVIRDIETCRDPGNRNRQGQRACSAPEVEAQFIQRRAELRTAFTQGEQSGRVVYEQHQPLAPQEGAEKTEAHQRNSGLKEVDRAPASVAPPARDPPAKARANHGAEPVDQGTVFVQDGPDPARPLGVRIKDIRGGRVGCNAARSTQSRGPGEETCPPRKGIAGGGGQDRTLREATLKKGG